MDWKWEHEQVLDYISDDNNILEIGSGAGGFLKGIKNHRKVNATGLEVNSSAINAAILQGIRLINEDLNQHAISHCGYYDVVCAFQVMEHIYDVKGFLIAAIKCLKPDGYLVISVPNNESFVGLLDPFSDRPPHHAGRYSAATLEKIAEIFGLKKISLTKEPLQKYHYSSVELALSRALFGKNRYIYKICTMLGGNRLVKKMVNTSRLWMNGHTLFAVFVK
jgi:SAM-dependent methyltransferase